MSSCCGGNISHDTGSRKSNVCSPEGKLAKEINTNKIIQGACRVPSSLYSMTKASMNVASVPRIPKDKHGSYDRYLARLKGKKEGPLRTKAYNTSVTPLQGNKTRMIVLMPNCKLCVDDPQPSGSSFYPVQSPQVYL